MTAELSRQQFWHLTDDPKFSPRADYVPEDNTFAINQRTSPGLYLTDSPERWVNAHGYVRPYAAQVSVPEGVARDERWGGEKFVGAENIGEVTVDRVIPLDAHAREEYGSTGWIEDRLGTTFDTDEPIKPYGLNATMDEVYPFKGYKYSGPDVRDMDEPTIQRHTSRMKAFYGEEEDSD